MMQTAFNLSVSRSRRNAGQTLVLSRQDIWREGYSNTVQGWFNSLAAGASFIGEDLRRYCLHVGMDKPSHHNAWGAAAGALIRRWLKAGLITQDGYGQANAVKAHARRYPRYVKAALGKVCEQ